MVKFRFSLSLIFFLLLLPSASCEVEINADAETITYGAPGNAFVDSGENVTFNATGILDAKSVLWDFGRDINGPETRYSESQNITHKVHASGRYNVTFTVSYAESQNIVKELVLIVNFEEDYQNNPVQLSGHGELPATFYPAPLIPAEWPQSPSRLPRPPLQTVHP